MKLIVAIMVTLAIVGCASKLTTGGSNVQQASANRVTNCTYVETFNAKNKYRGWYVLPSSDRKSAMINMKNRVAKAGGTHMVILDGDYSWGTNTAVLTAEAYRCN